MSQDPIEQIVQTTSSSETWLMSHCTFESILCRTGLLLDSRWEEEVDAYPE